MLVPMAALALVAVSCVEDFVPGKRDVDAPRLVVESVMTTDTTSHVVKLSHTAPYGSDTGKITPVSGAVVTVTDGGSTIRLEEDGTSGRYLTPETFHVQEGHTYRLDVQAEVGGETVSCSAEDKVPPSGIRADAFDYYRMTDSLWVFAIWGQDLPGIKSNYAADLVVNGVGNELGSWVFINGMDMFDGNYLYCGEYLFYYAHQGTSDSDPTKPALKEGDEVELYFYTVSDSFFKFLIAMTGETIPHFPLFSPQPANLNTNLRGGAVGTFCTAYLTKMKLVIGDPARTRMQMLKDHMSIPSLD